MDTYSIYRHTYNGPLYPHEMNYIGQAKDVDSRWNDGQGYEGQFFGEEFKKLGGFNKLTHEILESGIPASEIDARECYYIDKYNSLYRNGHGWNIYYGRRTSKTHNNISLPALSNELQVKIWNYLEEEIAKAKNGKRNFEFNFNLFSEKKENVLTELSTLSALDIPLEYNATRRIVKLFTMSDLSFERKWIQLNPLVLYVYSMT